jgi:hypothetical protein
LPEGRATVSAHDLVALRGIHPEAHGPRLDRFVELGGAQPLHQVERLDRGEQLIAVEALRRVVVLLSLRHGGSLI